MNKIGRKVYFLKSTGDVVYETGEMIGAVLPSTEEDDYINGQLDKYPADDIDMIEFEYGAHKEEFQMEMYDFFRINPETRSIHFYKKDVYRMRVYNEQEHKVDYSKEDICRFFDIFINVNMRNALGLDRIKFVWRSIDELNIRSAILNKSWVNYFDDDYLKESARDKTKIAESIMASGTYWTIVTCLNENGDVEVFEGNHRVLSAKLAQIAGIWNGRRFLTMEVDGSYPAFKAPTSQLPLNKIITQTYPSASYFPYDFYTVPENRERMLKEMAEDNITFYTDDEEVIQKNIRTYTEFMYSNQIFPHWLRDILYKFKQEHGYDFPTPTIFNDEDAWARFLEGETYATPCPED